MNEEQAVLDFFAKKENLPLGLSVAEQMDEIRAQINSRFWKSLQQRISDQHTSAWIAETIEDRNAAGVLVGLQCGMAEPQSLFLFPMLEQQYLGGSWRIFFGLMWNTPSKQDQLSLPAVVALKQVLADAGFKANENFLAWQWTNFYPRRSDFLLRYTRNPEKLLDEIEFIFKTLLTNNGKLVEQANTSLKNAPRTLTISLDHLHKKHSS